MSLSAEQIETLKRVNHGTRCLIHGFIRNVQKSLPHDNYHIIPDLVIVTCLLYCSFYDTWDKDNFSATTTLLKENTIQVVSEIQSIFLSQIVAVSNHNNYHWKFRLNKYEIFWFYNTCIGLWNIDHIADYASAINTVWTTGNPKSYGLWCQNTYLVTPTSYDDGYGRECQSQWKCKQGDIIEMCLNGSELTYKCNNEIIKDNGKIIKCNVEPGEYKAVIYISTNEPIEIELLYS